MNTAPQDSFGDEIVSTRILNVPRERAFEAFANPNHLVHWWGPKGFTNTFTGFDFRPEGAWRFTMHAPDGAHYQNAADFKEIARPERIVYLHLGPIHEFLMTMTFTARGDRTELTWRMQFQPHPDNEKLRGFIIDANEQNLDRLEAYLPNVPAITPAPHTEAPQTDAPGETRLEKIMKEKFGSADFSGLMNSIVEKMLGDVNDAKKDAEKKK